MVYTYLYVCIFIWSLMYIIMSLIWDLPQQW